MIFWMCDRNLILINAVKHLKILEVDIQAILFYVLKVNLLKFSLGRLVYTLIFCIQNLM